MLCDGKREDIYITCGIKEGSRLIPRKIRGPLQAPGAGVFCLFLRDGVK